MRSYIERAQDFIKEFYPYISDCHNHWQREVNTLEYNMDYNRRVQYCHGLTRIAFVTSDYVVKMDYDAKQVATFGGCESEIELYEEAEQDGMEYLFAKITRFEYQGKMFYIMPRIRGIGRKFWDAWAYMTDEESDWCERHDLHDLHNLNYGWKDNHVVLIDYGAHS